ncbi:MAG TPA: hypothetical protein VMT24_16930 [Aggregatilineaceae bacterium]|nr:hypothetical protein [Aggregatilineaceae bacterium]
MENPHFSSPQIDGQQCRAQRMANSMVCALGATEVSLRIAEPSSGDTSSQLGITIPMVEDVPLSPAIVMDITAPHEALPRYEVKLSTDSVQQAVSMYHVDDVGNWLLTALGLVYEDKVLHIDNVIVQKSAGADYLYRIFASE